MIMHCDDDQSVPINADLLAFVNEQKGFTMEKQRRVGGGT
jgi:hypothetical protein